MYLICAKNIITSGQMGDTDEANNTAEAKWIKISTCQNNRS